MPSLSEVSLSLTVPLPLATKLRHLAEQDCSSLASVARRLLAHGVAREIPHVPVQIPDGGALRLKAREK